MRQGARLTALHVAATYAGTIIGAGFASGQEIIQFFLSFGPVGLVGIGVAGLLFALLGWALLDLGQKLGGCGFHQALEVVCGRQVGRWLAWITSFFLFGTFTVMLAGAATVSRDFLGLDYWVGTALAGTLVAVTVLRGVRGIAASNVVITPLLILAVFGVSLYSLWFHSIEPVLLSFGPTPAKQVAPHWLLACILYVSYNVTIGSTVLVPLGGAVTGRKTCAIGSALGGAALGFLALSLATVVILHYPDSFTSEVPVLEVALIQHAMSGLFYAAILLAAMYTTSLATLFGTATKITTATGWPPVAVVIGLTLAAMLCGQLGFSSLIRLLFPAFGLLTLWFTARLVWRWCRGNRWR